MGNYYRWFDASEVPFSSGQRWLAAFLDDGLSPVALRTPSVLAGLALWFVVTRGVLGPALGPAGRSVSIRAVAALALLVWWLPFDLGARPEPLVALGTTTVVALVLRAVRPGTDGGRVSHPAALLAVAALVAGLTVTVAPSGLLAAAPFLLCPVRAVRAVRGAGGHREFGRAARITRAVLPVAHLVAIAGVAAVAVTVVFDRQSWHGFLVATDIHQQLGPNQPWYAEWLRYGYLFGDDSWGAAAKRVPVLLGLLLALTGLVLLARGRRSGELVGRESVLLLGLAPTGFALLAVTPSKWSHHFGALAGFGTVGLVVTVVALRRAMRARDPVVAGVAESPPWASCWPRRSRSPGRTRGGATRASASPVRAGRSIRSTPRCPGSWWRYWARWSSCSRGGGPDPTGGVRCSARRRAFRWSLRWRSRSPRRCCWSRPSGRRVTGPGTPPRPRTGPHSGTRRPRRRAGCRTRCRCWSRRTGRCGRSPGRPPRRRGS
ncbi:arabinosyltransferase domain-containing protein [Actinomycetospora sp. OC33-EN08]|uniref:Arabinosyltransferase domain-containing protein n=1 Tax=Actinomycetospora aurantiaca TaxID=3129233 RepID=A0ABU8MW09_9PSEU